MANLGFQNILSLFCVVFYLTPLDFCHTIGFNFYFDHNMIHTIVIHTIVIQNLVESTLAYHDHTSDVDNDAYCVCTMYARVFALYA